MSSISDIATSALIAYRTALTATGENIANVDTEGFDRRDVMIGEVIGGQMTASSSNSGSQGVVVNEVRRAMDEFMAEQVRATTSSYESASTFKTVAQTVEDLFMPGETGGIATGFDKFFTALATLSGNPSNISLRQSTLEAGRAMAAAVADVATSLVRLRQDTVTQANLAAGELTSKLASLNELNSSLNTTTNNTGGLNAVFDGRDRLLAEISELVGTTTTFDGLGRPTVRLGNNLGGTPILDSNGPTVVSLDTDEDLRLVLQRGGTEKESTLLTGGVIAGYRSALGMIDDTMQQLNALAQRVARDINSVHSEGVDLNGDSGGDLFILEGWDAIDGASNRGTSYVDFLVTDRDAAIALGDLDLTYDSVAAEWIVADSSGTELARGTETVMLDGLTMTITGAPANGDTLAVSMVTGRAIDMKLAIDEPELIAAAGSYVVSAAPANAGTAVAQMAQVPVATMPLTDLADVMAVTGTGADAVELLSAGVVGYVPAGSTSLSLAALGLQSSMDFAVSDAQAASAGMLTFSLDGTSYSFDLSSVGGTTAADLATALNNGSVTATTGESLSALGVQAAGVSGAFSLSRGVGNFDAGATLASGAGGASGTLSTAQAAGGTIQIFTRNGVQIAGTPMDPTSAAALMTTANGFLTGATYISDYLYPAGATGYRGMTLTQTTIPGAEALDFAYAAPVTWTAPATAAAGGVQTISVTDGGNNTYAFTLPAATTAIRAAELLNADLDGVNVSARTSVELTASADGTVSFKLSGNNVAPVLINGAVSGGRMDSIAAAINAAAGGTGITASLAPDGSRIVLTHANGEDISLTELTHSAGGTVTLTTAGADGLPSGAAVTLGAGADSARFTGTLSFESSDDFTVLHNATLMTSSPDALSGGLVTQTSSLAGATQVFAFATDPSFDGAASSVSGLVAQAASSTFSLTVNGETFSYTGVDGAAGLAAVMRDEMPLPAMTGIPVSTPPNGAATTVYLGEDLYTLRMSAGAVVVSGPEEGRLSAAFDGTGRLQIAVNNGGTMDGAALRVAPGAAGLATFGIAAGSGAASTLQGQVMTGAGLPATMQVEVAGTSYNIAVTAGSVTPAGGFPGTASLSGGRITFSFDSGAGLVRIPQSAAAAAAGFNSMDMKATVANGELTLASTSGAAIDADIDVSALAGQRITLDNLPPEDLIVVMSGSGTLRLGGSYVAGAVPTIPASVTVEIADAATGLVRLVDQATGHTIAQSNLNAAQSATLGGVQIALTGDYETGDAFLMTANSNSLNDGRSLNAVAALRTANPATGKGGFAQILAALQAQKGGVVSAATTKLTTAEAAMDSARSIYSDRTSVNLDEEAARLIEQQQAYQASAQVLNVAKDLFDTLLQSLG